MSLLGFDMTGTATINGLTEINANNVFSDELYYDASTTPVNVKTAIDAITVDITAAEADIVVLQSEMNSAQSDINSLESDVNSLQSDVNSLQSDVNSLQSQMNSAQSDIIALGVTSAATVITVAALVVSQSAQDVTIGIHTTQIGILQVDVNDAESDISALQTKTQHQSATGSKTAFSTKVEVGNVTLRTASESEFGDGLQSSSVEPLAVSSALAIGATQTSGTLNIGTLSTRSGDINIGTGASAKATVIGSSASTNTVNGTTTIAGTANINTTSFSNTTIGNGSAGGNFTVNAAANSITGTTNTVLGTTNVNTTGVLATSIGNTTGALALTGSTNTVLGTTNINTTGVLETNIGNTTGILALTGDDVNIGATDITLTTTGVANGVIKLEASMNVTLLSTGDAVYINNTGTASTVIGNTTGILNLTGFTNTVLGTTNINVAGTASTGIGNTIGTTTVIGQATFLGNTQFGDDSADNIVPNGTLTKPFIIGTYSAQSSYSTTSITPLTTFLGGTLESTKTFTNSATGTFRYIMASVSPFDANGAITLTAGTYMFWLALNFEDGAVFNITDLKMGLSTVSTLTTSSSEATVVASLPNLTCYFHKTDAADAATGDSEQRVLSSCFSLASSTTVYPFYDANHAAVTMDTVTCKTVFVKIGSA